jgi:thymidylate kinase
MKTLVLGCDASGKSSFIGACVERLGAVGFEATSSPEAKAFKLATLETPISEELINQREQMFLRLSRFTLAREGTTDDDVVTSSSSLVTRISHNAMRSVIGTPASSTQQVIDLWSRDEPDKDKPDMIVLVHAPINVISNRIQQRQNMGDASEKFWGFNSLFFLTVYQRHLLATVDEISKKPDMPPVCKIDSSKLSVPKSILVYKGNADRLVKI